jgi:TetR/AcrR family transcriptional regulator
MPRQTRSRSILRAPRHHDSTATRSSILQAAERIFAEVGPDGARTQAIAAAAGVNKALLYYYFRSKDGLYRAVLEERLKDFHRQALEVLSSPGSARSILLRYVSMHFDFISARPYYPRLFHRLAMGGGRHLERMAREHFIPLSRMLRGVIERGVRAGELRPLQSVHAAISLVALTVFYFSAAPVVRVVSGLDPYSKVNLARRKHEVLEFVRYALFREPEAPTR